MMNNNLKYQKNNYLDMSLPSRYEEFFLNADSVQIMYSLAEKNPDMTVDQIIKRTNLAQEVIVPLIVRMSASKIVVHKEEGNNYTLTEEALASLYKFHKEYVNTA